MVSAVVRTVRTYLTTVKQVLKQVFSGVSGMPASKSKINAHAIHPELMVQGMPARVNLHGSRQHYFEREDVNSEQSRANRKNAQN